METEDPLIDDVATSREQAMREREQLKKQAVSSLQKIEKWYNDRKQKAMESYISQSKIKRLEALGKQKIINARQQAKSQLSMIKANYLNQIAAFKKGEITREQM